MAYVWYKNYIKYSYQANIVVVLLTFNIHNQVNKNFYVLFYFSPICQYLNVSVGCYLPCLLVFFNFNLT